MWINNWLLVTNWNPDQKLQNFFVIGSGVTGTIELWNFCREKWTQPNHMNAKFNTFEPLQQFWINLPANWGEPNAKWLVRKFKNLTLLNIVKEPASCSLLLSTLFVNMAHRNNISKTNRKFVEDFYGDDPLQFIIKVFLQKTAEFKWWDFKQICKKNDANPSLFFFKFYYFNNSWQ